MSAHTQKPQVDTAADIPGKQNLQVAAERSTTWLLSHLPWLWDFITWVKPLRIGFNRLLINFIATRAKARPHPYSTWGPGAVGSADYVSWTGLVDRTYSGRHLPPAPDSVVGGLPSLESIKPLFVRQGEMTPCPKSSALFCFFAQWFTDSFLRTDQVDKRKNTSNHEIDLCQIYGLTAADAAILRKGEGGLLKSQMIGDQEFPPYLFEADGLLVKEEFKNLSYINPKTRDYLYPFLVKPFDDPARKAKMFAAGLERANTTIFYSAINTIFLREHNRLCREMAMRYPSWKDPQLFEAARNTNIVCILKIIIEDYINHISPALFKTFVDVGFAETKKWYRTNRICSEFNLLYRWHPLVPTELKVHGKVVSDEQFRFNNQYLLDLGLEDAIEAASTLRAGRIMLENTASFLVDAEVGAMAKSRVWRLKSYNDYRERFQLSRVESFEQLTGEEVLAAKLRAIYTNVNRVDLLVGLFAEWRPEEAVLGNLMSYMVGSDAFSQALTNPLLAVEVQKADPFSEIGRKAIDETSSFAHVVRRNTRMGDRKVTFTIQPS